MIISKYTSKVHVNDYFRPLKREARSKNVNTNTFLKGKKKRTYRFLYLLKTWK